MAFFFPENSRSLKYFWLKSFVQIVVLSTLRSGSGIWLWTGPAVPPVVGLIWVPKSPSRVQSVS